MLQSCLAAVIACVMWPTGAPLNPVLRKCVCIMALKRSIYWIQKMRASRRRLSGDRDLPYT